MRFGVLVLTHNEELQIEGCLRSLKVASPVVVLDSGSTDRTLDIVRSLGGAEIQQHPFSNFSDQRNHGIDCAFVPGTWVLHLDADERLTPELANELAGIEPSKEAIAYNIASRTYLGGRPVLRASGFPVYQTRLTRAGFFRFEQIGHGQKAPARFGELPRLRNAYDHHPFEKGYAAWRERHERYAQAEARTFGRGGEWPPPSRVLTDPVLRRQWLNHASASSRSRPALVWFYLMCIRGGFWDGPAGWEYCRLRYRYERMILRHRRDLQSLDVG